MPIYEYVCNECGYGFERLQAYSDDALEACPQCQGQVRRVISSVGVIFKGSGWYITDSKRQLSASPSKTSRQIADGGTGAGETKTSGEGGAKDTAAPKTSSGGDGKD